MAVTRIPAAATWGNTIAGRGWSGFSLWGGSLAFDTTVNWHFGLTTSGPRRATNSTSTRSRPTNSATSSASAPRRSGSTECRASNFVGSHARGRVRSGRCRSTATARTGPTPITVNGQAVSLDPVLNYGTRVTWSSLDQAALRDIGWAVGSAGQPACAAVRRRPAPAASPPPGYTPPVGEPGRLPVLVSGTNDGKVHVYARGSGRQPRVHRAVVHAVCGVYRHDPYGRRRLQRRPHRGLRLRDRRGTAAQHPHRERRDRRRTSSRRPTVLGGFGGGAFVAAGDLDNDGEAELAVSADAGGLPVVEVFRLASGQLVQITSILPLHSLARSGIRVAMGDLNTTAPTNSSSAPAQAGRRACASTTASALAMGETVEMVPGFLAFGRTMRYRRERRGRRRRRRRHSTTSSSRSTRAATRRSASGRAR